MAANLRPARASACAAIDAERLRRWLVLSRAVPASHAARYPVHAAFDAAALDQLGNGGSIVNISSILGLRTGGRVAAYAASKARGRAQQICCALSCSSIYNSVSAELRTSFRMVQAALVHLTQSLALEWARHKIRVHASAVPLVLLSPRPCALLRDAPTHATRNTRKGPLAPYAALHRRTECLQWRAGQLHRAGLFPHRSPRAAPCSREPTPAAALEPVAAGSRRSRWTLER
jgi:NAD(P)-dependent dehydrogenase (short-subunit alcohol dehydrogenase family)